MADKWAQARCVGMADFMFEAEKEAELQQRAKICRGCPLSLECLEEALSFEKGAAQYRHGIWGGTTPRQRGALRRRSA